VRNLGATVNFAGGTVSNGAQASPLGVPTNGVNNFLLVNNGLTAVVGGAGTFSANGYQYFGNGATGVRNLILFAEVNGNNVQATAPGDWATYTATGVTAFTDYITQNFSGNGTATVTTPSDLL